MLLVDLGPGGADFLPVVAGVGPVVVRAGFEVGSTDAFVAVDAGLGGEAVGGAVVVDEEFAVVLGVDPARGGDGEVVGAAEDVVVFADGKLAAGEGATPSRQRTKCQAAKGLGARRALEHQLAVEVAHHEVQVPAAVPVCEEEAQLAAEVPHHMVQVPVAVPSE